MNDVEVTMTRLNGKVKKMMTHSAAEIWEMLREQMVDALEGAAVSVEALRRKGEDISRIPARLRNRLLRIANGELSAKAFHVFGETYQARAIYQLPLAEQERLADGGMVDAYIFADGKVDKQLVDPCLMPVRTARKVFDVQRGRVRDEAEQRAWVEAERETSRALPTGGTLGPDRKRHMVCYYDEDGNKVAEWPVTEVAMVLGKAQ